MEFTLLYWHWFVIGMILLVAEMLLPSFIALWFALGAAIVGCLLWLSPDMALSWQLFIWTISSIVFTAGWFKFVQPYFKDRTKAGISREAALGTTGQVIDTPTDARPGVVRFTTPLLGDDEWSFISEQPVEIGDRVVVTDISGNTLIVKKSG